MRMSVPDSSRWVAKEWRRVWDVMRLGMAAFRAADSALSNSLQRRAAIIGDSSNGPWIDCQEFVFGVKAVEKANERTGERVPRC